MSVSTTVVSASVDDFVDEWVLELPFTKPLSLNDRMNHWAKAKAVKEWREAAHWLARSARIPACRVVRVELHYVPRDDRRRDPDNLVAAFKPLVDGLVDAGVVPDDTDEFVRREWPAIHPKGKPRANGNRFWLVVTRVE